MACCNHCSRSAPGLLLCGQCGSVSYCSKEHQKADWASHRAACLYLRAAGKKDAAPAGRLDETVPKGEFVGTLRWDAATKFPALPPPPAARIAVLADWSDWTAWRLVPGPDGRTAVEPAMMDALSFPVSLAYGLYKAGLAPKLRAAAAATGRATIAVIGAAARAEERILAETEYWGEVGHLLPGLHLRLVLVGPEVTAAAHGTRHELAGGAVEVCCHRGTLGGFLADPGAHGPIVACVGFNTGSGSAAALMKSWVTDLATLARSGLPCIMTCANDFCDLRGERAVMEVVLGVNYTVTPAENPFRGMTRLHEPGRRDLWMCANSYLYAFCGFRADSPGAVATAAELCARCDAVAAAAASDAESDDALCARGRWPWWPSEATPPPPIECAVADTGRGFTITARLPGVTTAAELEVDLAVGGVLTIAVNGEQAQEQRAVVHLPRAVDVAAPCRVVFRRHTGDLVINIDG